MVHRHRNHISLSLFGRPLVHYTNILQDYLARRTQKGLVQRLFRLPSACSHMELGTILKSSVPSQMPARQFPMTAEEI